MIETNKTNNDSLSHDLNTFKSLNDDLQSQLTQDRLSSKMKISKLQKELNQMNGVDSPSLYTAPIIDIPSHSMTTSIIDQKRLIELEQKLEDCNLVNSQQLAIISQKESDIELLKTAIETTDHSELTTSLILLQTQNLQLSQKLELIESKSIKLEKHDEIMKRNELENEEADAIYKKEIDFLSKTLIEFKSSSNKIIIEKEQELIEIRKVLNDSSTTQEQVHLIT